MITKITLDILTQDSVSVKTQKFIDVEGQELEVGKPHRKLYENSVGGRIEVQAELPEAQQNAIFAVWGDTPTVSDDIAQ